MCFQLQIFNYFASRSIIMDHMTVEENKYRPEEFEGHWYRSQD